MCGKKSAIVRAIEAVSFAIKNRTFDLSKKVESTSVLWETEAVYPLNGTVAPEVTVVVSESGWAADRGVYRDAKYSVAITGTGCEIEEYATGVRKELNIPIEVRMFILSSETEKSVLDAEYLALTASRFFPVLP